MSNRMAEGHRRRSWIVRAVGGVLAAALLAGCGGSAAPAGGTSPARASGRPGAATSANLSPYLIGLSNQDTGINANLGYWYRIGAEQAVASINRAGGVNGHPLKLVEADNRSVVGGAISAARQLVNVDHVAVLITNNTPLVLAQLPIAAQAHTALVTTDTYYPAMWKKSPWLVMTCGDVLQAYRQLIRLAISKGKKRFGLLVEQSPLTTLAQKGLTAYIKAQGGQVVASETFQVTATDDTPQLLKLRAAHPDVLLVQATGADENVVVKDKGEMGWHILYLDGVNIRNNTLIPMAGSAANGIIFWQPDFSGPAGQRFRQALAQKYHKTPNPRAGTTYDGVHLIAQAIAKNGYSGAAIIKGIASVTNYQGVLGKYDFNGVRENHEVFTLETVKNGKFVPYHS